MSIWPWKKSTLDPVEQPVSTQASEKPWNTREEAAWEAEAAFKATTGDYTYVVAAWVGDDEDYWVEEFDLKSESGSLVLFSQEYYKLQRIVAGHAWRPKVHHPVPINHLLRREERRSRMTREPLEPNPVTTAHALGYRHGLEGGDHQPTEEIRHRFLALAAYQRGKRIGTSERVMKALGSE